MNESTAKPIIFFDGLCGTCNAFADLILRLDSREHLLLAPIQGETARTLVAEDLRETLSSIVLRLPDGSLLIKSAAVWAIFGFLPYPWKLFALARIIPRPIADFGYSIVARYRYLLGGKRDNCRLPNEAERARFLD